MSDEWKPRKYDPKICAEIRANIEATCHQTIGERIEQATAEGNEWRVSKLQRMAQQQFNMMVQTNGDFTSSFADIREAFAEYSSLPGYDYRAMKEEALKEHWRLEWHEDGSYTRHPKSSNGGLYF